MNLTFFFAIWISKTHRIFNWRSFWRKTNQREKKTVPTQNLSNAIIIRLQFCCCCWWLNSNRFLFHHCRHFGRFNLSECWKRKNNNNTVIIIVELNQIPSRPYTFYDCVCNCKFVSILVLYIDYFFLVLIFGDFKFPWPNGK